MISEESSAFWACSRRCRAQTHDGNVIPDRCAASARQRPQAGMRAPRYPRLGEDEDGRQDRPDHRPHHECLQYRGCRPSAYHEPQRRRRHDDQPDDDGWPANRGAIAFMFGCDHRMQCAGLRTGRGEIVAEGAAANGKFKPPVRTESMRITGRMVSRRSPPTALAQKISLIRARCYVAAVNTTLQSRS